MAIQDVGLLIKRLRKQKGITQEELAFNIIDPTTLSKLERGLVMPHKKTIESLLEKLGYNPTIVADLFVDKKTADIQKILNELDTLLTLRTQNENAHAHIKKIDELIFTLENNEYYNENKLNLQYIMIAKCSNEFNKRTAPKEIVKLLTEAIQITIPSYDETRIDEYYLSRNELKIITMLAIAYEDAGDSETHIEIFYALKRNYDKFCVDKDEMGRTYTMIMYSLGRALHMVKRYKESLEACEIGIKTCHSTKYLFYLPLMAGIMSQCYCALGDKEKCIKLFKQAYYTLHMYGLHDIAEGVAGDIKASGIELDFS